MLTWERHGQERDDEKILERQKEMQKADASEDITLVLEPNSFSWENETLWDYFLRDVYITINTLCAIVYGSHALFFGAWRDKNTPYHVGMLYELLDSFWANLQIKPFLHMIKC